MAEKLDALFWNHTWDLAKLSPWKSVVGCKLVYKIKTWSDGTVDWYKACLVANGFVESIVLGCQTMNKCNSCKCLLNLFQSQDWHQDCSSKFGVGVNRSIEI